MANQLLFKIEDTFLLRGRGVVIGPFVEPIPPGFRSFTDSVVVKRHDGSTIELTARFSVEHFVLQKGSKNVIVISLPLDSKETIPVGSELWVSESTLRSLKQP